MALQGVLGQEKTAPCNGTEKHIFRGTTHLDGRLPPSRHRLYTGRLCHGSARSALQRVAPSGKWLRGDPARRHGIRLAPCPDSLCRGRRERPSSSLPLGGMIAQFWAVVKGCSAYGGAKKAAAEGGCPMRRSPAKHAYCTGVASILSSRDTQNSTSSRVTSRKSLYMP